LSIAAERVKPEVVRPNAVNSKRPSTRLVPKSRSSRPAVDAYKARHRRRFVTFDELFDVMTELGYHK